MKSFKVKKPYSDDFDKLMAEDMLSIRQINKGLYYSKLARKHNDVLDMRRVRVNGWILKKRCGFKLASDKFKYKVYEYEI